jgi:hypothetical protein
MFLRFSPGAATTSDARHSPLEHLATFPDAGPREEGTARKKSFETGVLAAEARTDGHRTSFQARRNRQSRTLSYESSRLHFSAMCIMLRHIEIY